MNAQFDFEVELHYHPENFDTKVRLEDIDETEDSYTALRELQKIEQTEAEINYNFQ